ncbi:MAG: hypothetical protein M3Z96_01565 [Pseudomonadota bacterium]|nr:hypothetical protein [Pseudomonadota bacterium]
MKKVKYVPVRESGRDNKQPRQGAVSAAARMAALTGERGAAPERGPCLGQDLGGVLHVLVVHGRLSLA